LQMLRGSVDSYVRLLRRFVEIHRDDMSRVSERLACGDAGGARQIVHRLKGAGGALGLHMHETAGRLEAGILVGSTGERLDRLVDEIEAGLARLELALGAISRQQATPIPAALRSRATYPGMGHRGSPAPTARQDGPQTNPSKPV